MAENLLNTLWEQLTNFEKRFSRFLLGSELNKLNFSAGQKVEVSPEMIKLIEASKQYSKQTGGLYNPLILPNLQLAGYVGSWPKVKSFDERLDYSSRRLVTADQIEITESTVQLPAGSAMDLGGIGKGYVLDELADLAIQAGCSNFWFSLGGDIICSGFDLNDEAWVIGIQDAFDGDKTVASVKSNGSIIAIATSGIMKRKGVKDSKTWHHIINPFTGLPAETDIMSSTLVAKSATEADIFAKCLIILGAKEYESFARKHRLNNVLLQIGNPNSQLKFIKTGTVWSE